MIDRWAYFFREAGNLDVVPPALSEGPFREALDVARTASWSPLEWDAYDRAQMAEQDARGAIAFARREGELKGKRETLLRFLARAGIALSEDDRARIQACADAAVLDRWLDNVLGAKTAADVLA